MRNLWVEIKADNTNQGICFAGAKIHTICRKVSSMKSVSLISKLTQYFVTLQDKIKSKD